ncbi:hypothetical protein [Lyngbya sp. PCC 8106]|uniref:hypothetical protein n=1 Tax=Lyngbya sp. (strain PCC 8106) TaxID=313612 RepID=UPI0000EAC264|nr:hypothetical protein [Lyngbya sp. PCC 8106]EAW34835.1 hypothetical protein L8106_18317 [Lyngbya sp. PCC 8106]
MVSDNDNRIKDIQEDVAFIKRQVTPKRDSDVELDLDEDGNMVTIHWTKLQTNPYSAHKLFGEAIKNESGVRRLTKCKLIGEAKKNSECPSKMRQVIFDKAWATQKSINQLEGLLSSLTEDEFIDFMREIYKLYHNPNNNKR